jgi:hypothetical protein
MGRPSYRMEQFFKKFLGGAQKTTTAAGR